MARSKAEEQARLAALTEYEHAFWDKGLLVGGMDEVGRGPLAGPVVAAYIVMPKDPLIEYVNDSKKLSQKKREQLYPLLKEQAVFCTTASASHNEIDEMNILQATKLAFKRAFELSTSTVADVLVDAVKGLDISAVQHPLIHGDALSYSIASASIIAKVERDNYMTELDKEYPQYGFARNKGYGTSEHIKALKEFGPCPYHRRSFVRNFIEEKQ